MLAQSKLPFHRRLAQATNARHSILTLFRHLVECLQQLPRPPQLHSLIPFPMITMRRLKSSNPFRLSPSRVILLAVFLSAIFLLLCPLPAPSPSFLPRPLSEIHIPTRDASHLLPQQSWKQPALQTIHASSFNSSHITLSLLTTGVDTQSFGRVFTPLACFLNRSIAFPTALIEPALVACHVPRTFLLPNTHITLLLRNDAALRDALTGPQRLHGERFQLYKGDVEPLRENNPNLLLHTDRLRSQLRSEGGPGLAYIRSDVHWQPRLLDDAPPHNHKYELCLMTAMKQYPFLLPPWLEYYRRLGVDQVFLYDNGAPVDLHKYLAKWRDFVQVVFWPWPRSQMQSNNHFLLASKSRCRFLAFFDADEFAMVGGGPATINESKEPTAEIEKKNVMSQVDTEFKLEDMPLLKRYVLFRYLQGYQQISFRFLVMVNSGYVRRPNGDLPELYTHRAEHQKMSSGKVIINRDREWSHHKIHIVKGKGKGKKNYWNMTLELEPKSVAHSAMLVHYTHRSWEDFVAKNKIGGASVMTAGRPPKMLDVDKPDPEYMNEASVKYEGFRDRWREIMKMKDTGRLTLTWKIDEDEWCRATFCPRCRGLPQLEHRTCSLTGGGTR